MRRTLQPVLNPQTDYSYLGFISIPGTTVFEVYLPDGTSYILDIDDLRIFLKKCDVKCWDKLVDFIYNFGSVLWNRMYQTYYPVDPNELLSKEAVNPDTLRELIYASI